jgi:hypothetical protein
LSSHLTTTRGAYSSPSDCCNRSTRMANHPKVDLAEYLPAGEWSDIEVRTPTGLMADREWAAFARARWLRGGGREAYLKFMVPAGSDAGPSSIYVTASDRLRRLHDRLLQLQAVGDAIPLVPLLVVQYMDRGLLIAMELITPLQTLVEEGRARDFSLRVLRNLDPGLGKPQWLHFDICPKNIGVLANSRCVLIDADSMYLEEAGHFGVSTFVWKPFRATASLLDEVNQGIRARSIGADLARRKVEFEVALAAAECVLGPLPPSRGRFDRQLLDAWAPQADSSDPAAEFWLSELRTYLATGHLRALGELARDLERILVTPRREVPGTDQETKEPPRRAAAPALQPELTPSAEVEGPPGWATDWVLLRPAAHALRAGKLDRERIREYRTALERLCEQYPGQRQAWEELLLLAITYEKDSVAALATAERALGFLPGDDGLRRLREIIQNWARERGA